MKKEKYFFITLISLLIIVLLIIFIKNYYSYKQINDLAITPFNKLSILNTKIELQDNKRIYNIEIDCTNLKEPNTQIVNYELNKSFKDSLITINTKIYNNNELLENNYEHITNINTLISITNKNKEYEQLYYINSICK